MPYKPTSGPLFSETSLIANTNVELMFGDQAVVLAIGFGSLENAADKLHVDQNTRVILLPTHSHLSVELMETTLPSAVAVPLLSMEADVMAVAEFLQSVRFEGAFCISTPDLPQPKLVMNEIKALCPDVPRVEFCSDSEACTCLVTTA